MAVKARQRDLLSRWGLTRVVAWNVGLVVLWAGFGLGVPLLIAAGVLVFAPAVLAALTLLIRALFAGRSQPR
jgi:hypothetical protein